MADKFIICLGSVFCTVLREKAAKPQGKVTHSLQTIKSYDMQHHIEGDLLFGSSPMQDAFWRLLRSQ